MHVIDVNSGHRVNKENSQEDNAFQVNIEAAKEIARQLRLRDMGGIIIVDFIDMHEAKHRKDLFDALVEAMSHDRAKHTILPPTKFARLLAIPASCSRVADYSPNWDSLFVVCSPSRGCFTL